MAMAMTVSLQGWIQTSSRSFQKLVTVLWHSKFLVQKLFISTCFHVLLSNLIRFLIAILVLRHHSLPSPSSLVSFIWPVRSDSLAKIPWKPALRSIICSESVTTQFDWSRNFRWFGNHSKRLPVPRLRRFQKSLTNNSRYMNSLEPNRYNYLKQKVLSIKLCCFTCHSKANYGPGQGILIVKDWSWILTNEPEINTLHRCEGIWLRKVSKLTK